jgi:RHS repeat-associated protein
LNGIETKITNQNYNFRDELTEKNLGAASSNGINTYLQSLDYSYNDQGWLTRINQATLGGTNIAFQTVCAAQMPNPGVYNLATNPDGNDLMYLEFNYDLNNTAITGLPSNSQKSGNISQIAWRVRGRDIQANNFTYDFMDRMNTSVYYDVNSGNTASATNRYNESMTYDSRGNITSLTRTGLYQDASNNCLYGTIDNLGYNYSTLTNRLVTVADYSSVSNAKPKGYNPGSGGAGYRYDEVGNLKSDSYKGITNITYNYLNLPQVIQWGNTKSIVHRYDASGTKLSKEIKTGNSTSQPISTFETGWDSWIDSGTNCDRVTNGGLSGSYSILIQSFGTSSMVTSPTYTLNTFDSVRIDFKFKAVSFEAGEDFFLEYSNNGGSSWTPVKNYIFNTDFINNVVYDRFVTLSAPLSASSKFRFRSDAGDTTDKIYVDNILVTGYTWTSQSIQDYVMGIEYNKLGTASRRIEAVYHAEGRYFNTSTTTTPSWRTEYSIKDHLGNTRLTFTDKNNNGKIDVTNTASTNEILQENHYYSFGMAYEGTWMMNDAAKDNSYQYNGKEYHSDHGLNWSDYGARMYDACIGRWTSVDPMAEMYFMWSSYHFSGNAPINQIDKNGMYYDWYNNTHQFLEGRKQAAEERRKATDMDFQARQGGLRITGMIGDDGKRFREKTYAALQMLTNDALKMDKNGRITIKERKDGEKEFGTELIRDLVDSKFLITITNDTKGNTKRNLRKNAYADANDGTFASNGIGTGTNIVISHLLNTSLLMQDKTREMVPYFIALGHELIHADRNRKGIRKVQPFLPKPVGNNEELQTIILENRLRGEHQGLKQRYTGI